MAEYPKPILGYWPVRGRVQYIRTMLAFAHQDYDYKTYPLAGFEDIVHWVTDIKPTFRHPLTNLPYWKEKDFFLTDSNAIMRYLAKQHGLAGKTPREEATADMLSEFLEEIRGRHIALVYRSVKDPSLDKNQFGEKAAAYNKDFVEIQLPKISKFLSEKYFLLGSEICYVDFILHEILYVHGLFNPELDLQKVAPNLSAFVDRFESIPAVAHFHKEEGKLPARSIYAPFADWQGSPKN